MVRLLEQHGLDFEYRNIASDPQAYREMVEKSRQYSSPSVEIDGHMLPDVGGREVEDYLRQKGVLEEAETV
ncbi:MAG: hypothetical protein GKR89_03260 [Candidatus Latescibacteria bacterium]|nr:hypothetical protein [Candidatus Latescibacterota bacterium]